MEGKYDACEDGSGRRLAVEDPLMKHDWLHNSKSNTLKEAIFPINTTPKINLYLLKFCKNPVGDPYLAGKVQVRSSDSRLASAQELPPVRK